MSSWHGSVLRAREAKFKHPDAADDTTSTTATSSEASGNETLVEVGCRMQGPRVYQVGTKAG